MTTTPPQIPTGTPGTVPSMDSDSPRWEAVRDANGVVWVHWAGRSWTRLYSPALAELFEPIVPTCCGEAMYRCEAEHTDGKSYLHCRSCLRNVEVL